MKSFRNYDEFDIANAPENEIIFELGTDGTWSFLRRYNMPNEDILEILSATIEDEDELNGLLVFFKNGEHLKEIRGGIERPPEGFFQGPLCG